MAAAASPRSIAPARSPRISASAAASASTASRRVRTWFRGTTASTARPIRPPTSASSNRVGAAWGLGSAAISTAEPAAWLATRGLPPSSVATATAAPTISPICTAPVPISWITAAPTAIPTAIPTTISKARRMRRPGTTRSTIVEATGAK